MFIIYILLRIMDGRAFPIGNADFVLYSKKMTEKID